MSPLLFLATLTSLTSAFLLYNKESFASEQFLRFMQTYNKVYKSSTELKQRQTIFEDNLQYIRKVNTQGLDWVLAVNEFSDLTPNEFSERFLGQIEIEDSFSEIKQNLQLPISVDWRAKGVVTPVMNQGSCSCGYAFASAGALESAWALKGHKLTMLSVQQVLDCSTGNKGCTSGTAINGFKYIQASGLTNSTLYPYEESAGKCNKTAAALVVAKASNYVSVAASDSNALLTALTLQPVAVGVDANTAIWQSYAGGTVTSTSCGTTINHFVLAVGYQTSGTVPYYILKNSWGPAWGVDGFIQLSVASGAGTCGVQLQASYPVV